MSNVMTDEDIFKKSRKEYINEIEIVKKQDSDPEAQNLISIHEATAALITMGQCIIYQENTFGVLNYLEEIDTFVKECYFKKL